LNFLRILVVLPVLLFMGCLGESDSHSKSSGDRDSFPVREGRRLYSHYCSPCHGENADGSGNYLAYGLTPMPPDFTSPEFLRERDRDLLATAISGGSAALGKSNLCPPWGNTLRAAEIGSLVDYIEKVNELANNVSEPGKEHDEKE
jgi:mono/diheme cytochrome c family protein